MSHIDPVQPKSRWRCCAELTLLVVVSLGLTWTAGCSHQRNKIVLTPGDCVPCQSMLQTIEYPDLVDEQGTDGGEFLSEPPTTISNFHELESWDLTVEDCVAMTLANSKVLQKLGGVVVNAPAAATTLYDQALIETNPNASVEAALSDFDAQFSSSFFYNRNENPPQFAFLGFPPQPVVARSVDNFSNFRAGVSKVTATGASLSYRTFVDYTRNSLRPQLPDQLIFSSFYNILNQMEFRQPLGRGAGTTVNRIAGPNAVPGVYNGVLIARIRSDISLADFETAVRNLVRDVENSYWELHFGFRNLDTILSSRDSAREIWENRKLRYENGVGRPDDEAEARQNYWNFEGLAQNALVGVPNGQPGVLGSERTLRRLMGLPVYDGRLIRPISEPTVAPVAFDWEASQQQALARRVELRRQKWTIRQRELELLAAKQLNKWQLDMVGQYGFRGFGDNLFGSRSRPNGSGSAFNSLFKDDLNDWQLGLEFGGPIGNRTGHLAIRNAELNLVRERTLLREQQRQILHDLGESFTEVDRAFVSLTTSFNSTVAVQEELGPKLKRVIEGQDQVFFLLNVQQRYATAQSNVHRAVASYNQALLNYSWNSGSLLSRYNIVLTEGPWSEDAQVNAQEKASRFVSRPPNQNVDNCPVSVGVYDQQMPGPFATTRAPGLTDSAPEDPDQSSPAAPNPGEGDDLNIQPIQIDPDKGAALNLNYFSGDGE